VFEAASGGRPGISGQCGQVIADRNFDFAGGQKTGEIIHAQAPDTRPLPNIQRGKPHPAPSSPATCRQISQSASENQGKLQKSI